MQVSQVAAELKDTVPEGCSQKRLPFVGPSKLSLPTNKWVVFGDVIGQK